MAGETSVQMLVRAMAGPRKGKKEGFQQSPKKRKSNIFEKKGNAQIRRKSILA